MSHSACKFINEPGCNAPAAPAALTFQVGAAYCGDTPKYPAISAAGRFILASSSPRRAELLNLCDIDFTVIPPESEEVLDPNLSLPQAIEKIAYEKALSIHKKYPDYTVIGADTVVTVDHLVLGKPKDPDHAFSMLRQLSGRMHHVITGVCILSPGKDKIVFHDNSCVTFHELSDLEITEYIQSGEPMDKAGSYGVQGKGAFLINKIDGDFYSVMGLPISQVYRILKELDR